jgi:hypothetical protein
MQEWREKCRIDSRSAGYSPHLLLAVAGLLASTIACSLGAQVDETATAQTMADAGGTKSARETLSAGATAQGQRQTQAAGTAAVLQTQVAEAQGTLQSRGATEVAGATADADAAASATESARSTQVGIVGEIPEGARGWPVLRADGFSTSSGDWWVGSDEDEWLKETRSIEDGLYRWSLYAKQSVFYRVWPSGQEFSDFYSAVDVCKQEGSATTSAGIIFRSDAGGNAYVFMVRNNGRYAFFELVRDTWNTRVGWTQATALIPGACNRIGVLARGDRFIFYANDQEIDQVADASLEAGNIGLGVELLGGESALWEFDDYVVLAP